MTNSHIIATRKICWPSADILCTDVCLQLHNRKLKLISIQEVEEKDRNEVKSDAGIFRRCQALCNIRKTPWSSYLEPTHVEEELEKSEEWEEHVSSVSGEELATHQTRQKERVDC